MKKQLKIGAENEMRRVFLLSLFFLCGMVLGLLLAGMLSQEDLLLLQEFFAARVDRLGEGPLWSTFWEVVWIYLRTLLLLELFSCCTAGVPLVLALCVYEAFSAAFTTASFACALGRTGVLFCVATLGIRYLFLLSTTIRFAAVVLKASVDKGNDGAHRQLRGCAVRCAAALLLGAVLETLAVPKLVTLFLI